MGEGTFLNKYTWLGEINDMFLGGNAEREAHRDRRKANKAAQEAAIPTITKSTDPAQIAKRKRAAAANQGVNSGLYNTSLLNSTQGGFKL